MKVRIITAERNSGKTTYINKLINSDKKSYLGFLSVCSFDKEKFFIQDIESKDRFLLMDATFHENWEKIGRYYFEPEIFEKIEKHIKKRLRDSVKDEVIVIDEVGRLELRGRGFDSLIRYLLNSNHSLLISVRSEFLSSVIERYEIKNPEIIKVQYIENYQN